jgi:hypothetical protein
MSSVPHDKNQSAAQTSRVSRVAISLAVALCIACCALILLIPTASTNVDTVYQGF